MCNKPYDDTPFIDDSNEGYYSPLTWEEALALKPSARSRGPHISASLCEPEDEFCDWPHVRYDKREDRLEFRFVLKEISDGAPDKVLMHNYPVYIYSNEKLVLTEMDFPEPYKLQDVYRAVINNILYCMDFGNPDNKYTMFQYFYSKVEEMERLRQKYKPE